MYKKDEEILLDYCRVKKIFEKGFGFLSSLYYPENVFFHFSKIRNEETREKLENLKRGDVYLFYTSELKNRKRRVVKIWLDLKQVPPRLLPKFITRIIAEFYEGRLNIFELAHVVKELDKSILLFCITFNLDNILCICSKMILSIL